MNVLLRHCGTSYSFANVQLQTNDGSIYITLKRDRQSGHSFSGSYNPTTRESLQRLSLRPSRRSGVKISYHSSGRVRYHGLDFPDLFLEPIAEIKQSAVLLRNSIPKTSRLPRASGNSHEGDAIIEIPDEWLGRWDAQISISPWGQVPAIEGTTLSLGYKDLCSVHFTICTFAFIPPINQVNNFIRYRSQEGLFDKQKMDKDTALTKFHQKATNQPDMVIYSPNREGIYMLIFGNPMRIPPRVRMEFYEAGLSFVEVSKTKAMLKFQIKDRYKQTVKRFVRIKSILLDAELY